MKLILLSGGAGKRLWPMSNDSCSKQFLGILKGHNGTPVSMLQRVWQQINQVGLQSQTYICASKAQKDMIVHQLGEVPFIEEPERRDTFPAIALACLYLYEREECSRDEFVAVAPIDHLVDDQYFREIARLHETLDASGAELALMGVKPAEPSSKFGYIQVADDGEGGWLRVKSFIEKPKRDVAEKLIRNGALWNCGVFGFRLGYILDVLKENNYSTSYREAKDHFNELPKCSFDYEVVEKADSIAVLPYTGVWKDLGTWDDVFEAVETKFLGKGKVVECENTHIINELNIPIIGVGLNNVVIVATPNGILVTDKAMSTGMKDVVMMSADPHS
ncbi:MAG: sugar phosphate nucleotidyltransferase [Acidibacillus sp.]|nr:sugar phosphate nucleotidyltransferase [Acidibacillus sp.]